MTTATSPSTNATERPADSAPQSARRPATVIDVLVVGAGFAGMCTAVKLKEAGVHDFVILEKGAEFGGTWWHNTYPGCAVDVMAPLYSFSFAQKSDWSSLYAPQPELLEYAKGVAEQHGLRPYARFGVAAVAFTFDEAQDRWEVTTSAGDTYLARAVVGGFGGLHVPKIPEFKGREKFHGPVFHSAQWRHDVDLTGKKVVVIGTGASAVQFVPEVAKQASLLAVFMRSPHWILPRFERKLTSWQQAALKYVPGLRRAVRAAIFFGQEALILPLFHRSLMRPVQAIAQAHLRSQVADPKLQKLLTPNWTLGCKRIVMSSDYYPALQRPNVTVESSGVAEFTEHGVRSADGALHEADVVILGTGFEIEDAVYHMPIRGVGGRTIKEQWTENGPEQYLGVSMHGFPNLFTIVGLNSAGGNQSIIFTIEAQVHHIVQCLKWMLDPVSTVTRAELRETVMRNYNRVAQQKLKDSVWNAGGCNSWYLNDHGRNVVAWPGSFITMWFKTRKAKRSDYELSNAESRAVEEGYQGPAELELKGEAVQAEVDLRGHFNPIDGKYHWYGRIAKEPRVGELKAAGAVEMTLRLPGGEARTARLAAEDAWGNFRVVGVGAPPYVLEPLAVEAPV